MKDHVVNVALLSPVQRKPIAIVNDHIEADEPPHLQQVFLHREYLLESRIADRGELHAPDELDQFVEGSVQPSRDDPVHLLVAVAVLLDCPHEMLILGFAVLDRMDGWEVQAQFPGQLGEEHIHRNFVGRLEHNRAGVGLNEEDSLCSLIGNRDGKNAGLPLDGLDIGGCSRQPVKAFVEIAALLPISHGCFRLRIKRYQS